MGSFGTDVCSGHCKAMVYTRVDVFCVMDNGGDEGGREDGCSIMVHRKMRFSWIKGISLTFYSHLFTPSSSKEPIMEAMVKNGVMCCDLVTLKFTNLYYYFPVREAVKK